MRLYDGVKEILKIQKFRRIVSYAGFYCFTAVLSYAYASNTWVTYNLKRIWNGNTYLGFEPHAVLNIFHPWFFPLLCLVLQNQSWVFQRRPILCVLPSWNRALDGHSKGTWELWLSEHERLILFKFSMCLIWFVLASSSIWYLNSWGFASCIKLLLVIVSKTKSGVPLSIASWPNTLSDRVKHPMRTMP